MQKENEYGRIIAYERKRANLSVEQLCEGICSPSYLRRIERGERSCEKILADVLLQRIGVSAEKFSYILNVQEQDLIVWKEKIVDLVDRNQKEEAYRQIECYREQTKGKSVLYIQFCMLAEAVLEWKNHYDTEIILEKIFQAWNLTQKKKAILSWREQRLSYFELSLVMLYLRLLESREEEKKMIEEYQGILLYLEEHIEKLDRVKWYPQIAYRLIRLLKKNGRIEQAFKINERAIWLLQNHTFIFYLKELLETYQELLMDQYGEKIKDMPQDKQKQFFEIDGICKALNRRCQEYQVEPFEWIWDISFGTSEIYLCQEIVRGRRIGMGMSQEELAEGICEPVTISRIECGYSYPKRGILVQLLQKLKWSGENCTLTAQIGSPEFHRITSKISTMTYLGRSVEVEPLLEELEKRIGKKNIFAEQYFLSNYAVVQFGLGKKSAEELYALSEEALYLTVPKLERKKWKEWHFTRSEVMCINAMSYGCESVGKAEYVIELLEIVKEFYERQTFELKHYRAGYVLTVRNLGSLLGNLGKYKESIVLADLCIRQGFISKEIGIVAVALYDKGWDLEHLWKDKKFDKQESLSYVEDSYYLNLFLDRKIQYEFSKKHIQELYGEDISYYNL